MKLKPFSNLIARGCCLVILSLALGGGPAARAQDTDTAGSTNDLAQADENASPAGVDQAEDSGSDSEMAAAPDANSAGRVEGAATDNPPNGRDARTRRFRRRSGQPGGSGSSSFPASTNSGPASLDYSSFRSVATLNIFDPNRFPRRTYSGPRARPSDSFTLVGTMSYEKGAFAFFSGSSSEYEKALKLAGSIAGCQVAAIGDNSVKLLQGTNQLELHVGARMRREEGGLWSIASASYDAAPPAAAPPSSEPVPDGPDGDILKRLMQRREKE